MSVKTFAGFRGRVEVAVEGRLEPSSVLGKLRPQLGREAPLSGLSLLRLLIPILKGGQWTSSTEAAQIVFL